MSIKIMPIKTADIFNRKLTITDKDRVNYTFNKDSLSKYQKDIQDVSKEYPKLGERYMTSLLQKESSLGSAPISSKEKTKFAGDYGWLVGFSEATFKDIQKKSKNDSRYRSLADNMKFDTPKNAIRAAASFSDYRAKIHDSTGKVIGYEPIADKIYLKYNGKPEHQQEFRKVFNVNYNE